MKRWRNSTVKASPILFVLILSAWAPLVIAQTDDKTTIDRFIAAQAAREHGEEPDGVREVVKGDLNNDGVADTAVLYTIEGQNGSNNYIQYLAVFLRKNGRLVFTARQTVGGKNRKEIDLTSIANNSILLATTAYGPKDPSCCPTIKGHTKYVVISNRLVERPAK